MNASSDIFNLLHLLLLTHFIFILKWLENLIDAGSTEDWGSGLKDDSFLQ